MNGATEPRVALPHRINSRAGSIMGGRFQLHRFIAAGGMGEIWEACDQLLGRRVALKLLRTELAANEEFRDRFRAEARAAASVNHPNVVSVFDFGERQADGGIWQAYLVMEFVPGRSLAALLTELGPLPPAQVAAILEQAASGLAAAHARGLVHRDVKPGNLLVTPDGTVKITDFGIARAADGVTLTRTGVLVGTAQYIAPEQAAGRAATARSDLYSLGVVAFTALAGQPPFDAPTDVATALAHLRDPPPPLPARTPVPLRNLVGSLLAKDPAVRPGSAAEVARLAAAAGAPVATAAPAATATAATPREPRPPAPATQRIPRPQPRRATELIRTSARRPVVRGTLGITVLAGFALIGLAASASGAPTQVDVPRVIGEQLHQATTTLNADGLAVKARPVDVPDVRAGTVVAEDPRPGAPVRRGSTVVVTVATGRVDVVPARYLGLDAATATAELNALGLHPAEQFVPGNGTPGSVVALSPSGEVPVGSVITVRVDSAPAAPAQPAPSPTAPTPTHTGPAARPPKGRHHGR